MTHISLILALCFFVGMAIVKYPPNLVWLGGTGTQVGDVAAGVAIVPGMLIERYNSSGIPLFRPCTIVTALGVSPTFALNQSMVNQGINVPYAIGDLVEALIADNGATVWGLVATAAPAIVIGDKLESAGDGTMRKWTTGTPIALALEPLTNISGSNARLRLEVIT
jgi:hypothetical protein